MDIRNIKIEELNPAKYNPRKKLKPSDSEYQKIKKSIEEFGLVEPLVVNSDMTVIGGHQRLNVLKELKYAEVQCVVINIDKTKEKALNLALNKITGEWDIDLLKDLLHELNMDNFDLQLTGFDIPEIDDLLKDFNITGDVEDDGFDSDKAIDDIEVPITNRGDIWVLGNHRLMCGDATNLLDVEKLMNNKLANLVIIDPPYNVDYVGKTKDALKIKNDKMNDQKFYEFLYNSYLNLYKVSADGAGIYVFHADSEGHNFRKAMIDAGWKLAQCCIWVKNSMVMGRQDYHWQHEPILYGWKPTGSHNWYSDRKQTTIWNYKRPTTSKEHPTMKPLDLIAYPIKNNSLENSIVVDLFGSSGSTLIASEKTNRICYTMELDEKYCDVIIKRWETLTGLKAVRLNE